MMTSATATEHEQGAGHGQRLRTAFQGTLRTQAGRANGWLLSAARAVEGGGVSRFYSKPLRPPTGWARPDVESTALTARALVRYANATGDGVSKTTAGELGCWLVGTMMPDGALPAGELKKDRDRKPGVWATAQALFAFLALHDASQDETYQTAANRAAEWLRRAIHEDEDIWTEYTEHSYSSPTYYTEVTWAMLEAAKRTQNEKLRDAALEAATRLGVERDDAGGFRNWGVVKTDVAPLQTVAAAIAGFVETGRLLGSAGADVLRIGKECSRMLKHDIRTHGELAGGYDETWEAARWYAVPSGIAQMARLWLREYERDRDLAALNCAYQAMTNLVKFQEVDPLDAECGGALPGSSPLWGGYEKMSYPTKVTAHALLAFVAADEGLQRLLERGTCE